MFLIIVILFGSFPFTQCTTATSEKSPTTTMTKSVSHSNGSTDVVAANIEPVKLEEEISETQSLVKATEKEVVQEILKKESKTKKLSQNKPIEETQVNEPNRIAKQKEAEVKNQNPIPDVPQVEVGVSESRLKEPKTDSKPVVQEQIEVEKVEYNIDQNVLSHDIWDAILQANVSVSGSVNYGGVKSSEKKLDEYLSILSNNTPESSWSKNKTKAYWINAYNAFTIKLILDNYPLGSIMDLHGGKPWDKKWIKLGSKTYSLNDIEHVILRPTYNDPRIHFAVNCAAKSCPKVWNNAWTEENIESALDKLTKEFIANSNANQISEKKVSLSKIFDWYKEDFGDLIQFLNKYSTNQISPNAKISFNEYDWKLNS